MTTDERFERDLPDLLAQLAPRVTVDYRDAVVQETATMTQRPGWSFPGRWLPDALTTDPGRRRPRTAVLVTTFLVVTALVTTMLVVAGVGRRTVPAPFGPATNGAIYFASGGDIYRQDSLTSTPVAIVTDDAFDTSVVPSRDGTKLAILRSASGGTQVVVTDADGRDPVELDGRFAVFSEIDWSPDGRDVAVVSERPGYPILTILPVDGSAGHDVTLPGDMTPAEIWYLPDGRIFFDGTTHDPGAPTYGLYIVDPTSGDLTVVSAPTTEDLAVIGARPSPDGTKVVYHRWREPDEKGRIHVIDLATGKDQPFGVDYPTADFSDEVAQFSPDGGQLLFVRFLAEGNRLVLVPSGGGTAVGIGPVTPGNDAPEAAFTPDGRSVIAFYPTTGELWLLDATGTVDDIKLELPVTEMPLWQRTTE